MGAIVVRDGHILGEGFERTRARLDPAAHAEVEALRAAQSADDRANVSGSAAPRVAACANADAPAVVITDRYREIYHIFRPTESGWPPTADEVQSWLVFMNIQCPECGAPEW